MALLKDNNNTVKADEETSTERVQYISEDVSNEGDEDSNDEDYDEEDQEPVYFYDCVGCKNILRDINDLYKHNVNCHEVKIVFKPKIQNFRKIIYSFQ